MNRIQRVIDRRNRFGVAQFDDVRAVEHFLGQGSNLRRHGCREQQVLPPLGERGEDAPDVGQEAHVEHVIGLVEHQRLDAVEPHGALVV